MFKKNYRTKKQAFGNEDSRYEGSLDELEDQYRR